MASFSAGATFTDGVANDVTAAKLGALVNNATPTSGLIQDRTAETVTATNDTLLIGDASDSNNLKRITVANFSQTLPTAKITTGTIETATLGTTTGTAATFTNGTIQTLTSSTLSSNLTGGTYSGVVNSSTGTFGGSLTGSINATSGTIQTLTSSTLASNLTGGTYSGSLNATTGTVQTLTSSTATISEIATSKNFAINVGTLSTTSGTQGLDFTSQGYLTHSITGNITYTATNYAAGKSLSVRITSDGTARNLTFPTNWVFVGLKPTSIAASKNAVLSVTSFGTTEANTVAAYAVQA
ncbi:hypothetical protein EBZ39_11900 [bacterium]|nr:hypothetical protein [bacterium]